MRALPDFVFYKSFLLKTRSYLRNYFSNSWRSQPRADSNKMDKASPFQSHKSLIFFLPCNSYLLLTEFQENVMIYRVWVFIQRLYITEPLDLLTVFSDIQDSSISLQYSGATILHHKLGTMISTNSESKLQLKTPEYTS